MVKARGRLEGKVRTGKGDKQGDLSVGGPSRAQGSAVRIGKRVVCMSADNQGLLF